MHSSVEFMQLTVPPYSGDHPIINNQTSVRVISKTLLLGVLPNRLARLMRKHIPLFGTRGLIDNLIHPSADEIRAPMDLQELFQGGNCLRLGNKSSDNPS
jgi:hypothetical protein